MYFALPYIKYFLKYLDLYKWQGTLEMIQSGGYCAHGCQSWSDDVEKSVNNICHRKTKSILLIVLLFFNAFLGSKLKLLCDGQQFWKTMDLQHPHT